MHFTLFSIIMTFLWSTLLIILFCVFRKRLLKSEIINISGIMIIYIFCIIRLLLPIEFPWTKVLQGVTIWNYLQNIVGLEIINIYGKTFEIGDILTAIWILGIVINLYILISNYRSLNKYISKMQKEKYEEIKIKHKKVTVYKSDFISSPCSVGIIRKTILLPNVEYDNNKLEYIIMHELAHHNSNDLLTKLFLNIIDSIYWWNPFMKLLKKGINQSMEIRCDQNVVYGMCNEEKAQYLEAILEELSKEQSKYALHSEYALELVGVEKSDLVERFSLVVKEKKVPFKYAKLWILLLAIILYLLSYSVVIQPYFAPPEESGEGITYFSPEDSYVYESKSKTYYLITPYDQYEIPENEAAFYLEMGFVLEKE